MVALMELLIEVFIGFLYLVVGAAIGILVLFVWIKRDDPGLFEEIDRWIKRNNKE